LRQHEVDFDTLSLMFNKHRNWLGSGLVWCWYLCLLRLEQDETIEPYPEDLGQQFTEMFVKQTENVSLLLSLLQVWLLLMFQYF